MLSPAGTTRVEGNGRAFRFAFGVLFFTLIYLQKIGVGSGDITVSLALPTLYAVLACFAVRGCISVSLSRLSLFVVFSFFATLSQILASRPFSILSFIFLISMYLPITLVWHLSRAEWLRIMSLFQNMMILPALLVFVQIFWQLVLHFPALSIDPFIPHGLEMQGFMYAAPIIWGQPLLRPNGFFMLEPSYISAFAACALVMEVVAFHRTCRIMFYAASLWACTGATGLVLAAVALPIVLARRHPSIFILACGVILVGVVLAFETGAGASMIGRLSELQNQDSSGFGRLVAPLIELHDATNSPDSLFAGLGAGNSGQLDIEASTWPLVKLGIEYGMPTLVVFSVFNIACCWHAPVPALAAGMYFVFNFTGGYLLNPVFVILIMLLVTGLRVTRDEDLAFGRDHTRLSYIGSVTAGST